MKIGPIVQWGMVFLSVKTWLSQIVFCFFSLFFCFLCVSYVSRHSPVLFPHSAFLSCFLHLFPVTIKPDLSIHLTSTVHLFFKPSLICSLSLYSHALSGSPSCFSGFCLVSFLWHISLLDVYIPLSCLYWVHLVRKICSFGSFFPQTVTLKFSN